jgi:hypothetical protein
MVKSRALTLRSWTFASLVAGAVAALALSGAALAGRGGGGHGGGGHGGGGHGGGGHGGGAHFSRGFSGARHFTARSAGRSFTSRNISRSAGTVGHGNAPSGITANTLSRGNTATSGRLTALNAHAVSHSFANREVTRALHTPGGLRNPAARAAVTAAVATAALHHHDGRDRDGRGGWWRHAHGGYGWVGPVFWPYAGYDMYDYAFWGYDPSFWDYGYGDLYAGMFGLYGYDALSGYAGYLPGHAARGGAPANGVADQASLADMCGEDSHDIAGLPTDRIRDTLQLNDEQRAALDELAAAMEKAAQAIRNSCPGDIALTAPSRLATMQSRIAAMRTGVTAVQPSLDRFYALLSDEQKAKYNGMAQDQQGAPRSGAATAASTAGTANSCDASQPGATDWPGALIEQMVHPTDAQRASLATLQDATARAADILKASCLQPTDARTPPARLSAIGDRLTAMDKAVGTVRPALEAFYGSLSDEQKAGFDAIGPQRSGATVASAADDEETGVTQHRHHRHGVSVGGMIRRMMGFVR